MITRTWHGIVPLHKKTAFLKYLDQTGINDTTSLPGNCGAYVKAVDQNEFSHVFLCTVWETLEDIISYAGKQYSIAVTYPEDDQYGLISDPIVIHQEVTSTNNPFEYE
ncbi:hypothetical protein [Acetobacterium woodii]|uniref:Antibiotic biosynthesis monooxygenase n=1 Tax=Acetobacterium woodii (strain ATCC 29683 / DSM 1030 / JCM 2381 / KCTC 1655 / WB1) TaxID=931626 RepID=H6LBZ3_ACEWD|nr:hypothetical protein [Acetobacterium woodii]AFA47736.1 hypothetical protein Awo_c09480 [Acetobacterium woodii DSM 1030]